MFTYSAKATTSNRPILQAHQHRLIALHLSLQEAVKHGHIRTKEYASRAKFIRHQLVRIEQLLAIDGIDQDSQLDQQTLGLPNMQLCSPEEQQLCAGFLRERQALLETLYKEAAQTLDACQRACEGRGLRFWHTIALSRLKKKLTRIDFWENELDFDDRFIDDSITRLAGLLNGRTGKTLEGNLHGLMSLFNELDAISARIAKLQATVREDEQLTDRMRHWLQGLTRNAKKRPAFHQPPAPAYVAALSQQTGIVAMNPLAAAESQLKLARRYIETGLAQAQQTAAPNTPTPAANQSLDFSAIRNRQTLTQLETELAQQRRRKPQKKRRRK